MFIKLDDIFFEGRCRKKGLKENKDIDRNEKVLVPVNKEDNKAYFLKMTSVHSLAKKMLLLN